MPYGRQIAEEEQHQDRRYQVSEREARREEDESFFEEQRLIIQEMRGDLARNFVEPGPTWPGSISLIGRASFFRIVSCLRPVTLD